MNTITQITVSTEEHPLFGDGLITLKLEDEGGGMFLVMEQDGEDRTHQVRISFSEWEDVCQAVATLANQPLVK